MLRVKEVVSKIRKANLSKEEEDEEAYELTSNLQDFERVL